MKCSILFLLVGSAFAQFTTVTGTVVDPNGVPYAFGTIMPLIVSPSGTPTLNGFAYTPPTQPTGLDKNGSFMVNVADNAVLQPAGTKWNFTVCSAVGTVNPAVGKGSVCFMLAAPITITGPSQSISTNLNTIAPPLTVPLGGGGGGGNIANGTGPSQAPTWNQTATQWQPTNKPAYNVNDPAWGFVCDGVTYNTSAAIALLNTIGTNPASIQASPQSSPCGIGDIVWPKNVTLDFSTGWQLKTLTDSTTTPGNGQFDSTAGATGHCESNNTTPTCAMAVTAPAGDSYALVCGRGFSSGAGVFTSNVSSDVILTLPGSNTSFTSITQLALVPSVTAGAHTFTATFPGNLVGACTAVPISGLGPTPYLDGAGGTCSNVSANSPYSCTGSFTAGSFLLFFGSQNNTTETCGAVGGGFTIVPGAAGCSTNTASNTAIAYQNAAAGGSVTPTIAFAPSPAGHFWSAQVIGLRPSSGINQVLGGINNPANNQIFVNATGNAGLIDFTGNLTPIKIRPEWWGATNSSLNATTNTAALQAAEKAAYGTNRLNGSGLNQYNKQLVIDEPLFINCEIQLFHVIGAPNARAKLICENGGSITQTATNQRIFNMQSVAYWDAEDCAFSSSASQDAAHPLWDNDFDGVSTPGDLAPQFTTCYNCSFFGNGVAAVGLFGAKSGGAAQYSNEYCLDCTFSSFTQACWQIGTASKLATNALAIGFSGDMQGCPQYGIVTYGGGYVSVSAGSNGISSMENGFSTQTGYDMAGALMQGPCIMEHMRSESRKLISCPTVVIKDSRNIDQGATFIPGATQPVGTYMRGDYVTGDGAYHIVTVDSSGFAGVATLLAPLQASSGTATSLTDTNQTVAGSVTIGSFGVTATELMTQAVTGSTGTRLNAPSNNATIAGTLTSGNFASGDTAQQATTAVTCTVGANNTASVLNCSNFSGAPDNSHTWTDLTTLATFNPSATPVFAPASPVMLITAATGAPDNTHDWVGGTTGMHYTPTALPVNEANFTVNAFTGLVMGIPIGGTSGLCFGTVTSNTAQTITFSGGLSSKYPFTVCPPPDNTTKYFVTCALTHGTDTCGGITMQYVNENVIAGDIVALNGAQGRIEDVVAPGGQIFINGNFAAPEIRNLQTTRSDWFATAGGDPQSGYNSLDWDVRDIPTGSPNGLQRSWALPAITGTPFNGGPHRYFGAVKFCWETGTIGLAVAPPNTSANDVCAGGRSDQAAGTDVFRNRFEIPGGTIGGIGPAVPTGVDQNGVDTNILAGGSTGASPGGHIKFGISQTAASGATPNSGTFVWQINKTTGNLEDLGSHAITPSLYATTTNCAVNSVSPAACGSAASGAVVIPTTTTTYTINTTAVTAHSRIQITWLTFASDLPSAPTCVAPVNTTEPTISAVSAGVSFTITLGSTTGQTCPMFQIFN